MIIQSANFPGQLAHAYLHDRMFGSSRDDLTLLQSRGQALLDHLGRASAWNHALHAPSWLSPLEQRLFHELTAPPLRRRGVHRRPGAHRGD